METKLEIYNAINVGDDGITSLSFSQNSAILASGRHDSYWAQIWNSATGQLEREYRGHLRGQVSLSPDGSMLATGGLYGPARLYDTVTAKVAREISDAWPVHAVSFTPDGQHVAIVIPEMPIQLWNPQTGDVAGEIEIGDGHVCSLDFAPFNGHVAFALLEHGLVRICTDKGVNEVMAFTPHYRMTYSVAFSPDGTKFATCGDDKMVRLWDTKSWNLDCELKHNCVVLSVAFSPDGRSIVTGGQDGTIRRWMYR